MFLMLKIKKIICVTLICLSLLFVKPQPAQAQVCDTVIALGVAAAAFGTAQSAAVAAFEAAFQLAVQIAYDLYTTTIIDVVIDDTLNEAWRDHLGDEIWSKDDHGWHDALQFTMAQQHIAIAQQTLARGTFADARQSMETEYVQAGLEADLRDEMTPSGAVCVANTMAPTYSVNIMVSEAVQKAQENDMTSIFLNKEDSISAAGRSSYNQERWENFTTIFCNHDENNAEMPCDAALPNPNPYADHDISVSDTLYGYETYDLSVPENVAALQALTRNLTAVTPNSLYDAAAYTSVRGREEVLLRRQTAARDNAVQAALASVWADRVPYELDTNTHIRDARNASKASGILSDTPSKYEIRQAMVEQVLSPEFHVETGDNIATVKRRDVILQAQQLMMLNDLIEKTEKMAVLFSVQLAAELDAEQK